MNKNNYEKNTKNLKKRDNFGKKKSKKMKKIEKKHVGKIKT
jgi:hypothetical protein